MSILKIIHYVIPEDDYAMLAEADKKYIDDKRAAYRAHNESIIHQICSLYPDLQAQERVIFNAIKSRLTENKEYLDWQLNENELLGTRQTNQSNRDRLANFFRLLISYAPDQSHMEEFIKRNSKKVNFEKLNVLGDGNCFYYSVLAGLIYSIFTGDISNESKVANILRKPDGFLDEVILQLKKHGVMEISQDEKNTLPLQEFFKKCFQAYATSDTDLQTVALETFLSKIATPALRKILYKTALEAKSTPTYHDACVWYYSESLKVTITKNEVNETHYDRLLQNIKSTNEWGGAFLQDIIRDTLGVRLDVAQPSRHISGDLQQTVYLEPTIYLLLLPGHFNVRIPSPYTKNEQEWYTWLEKNIRHSGVQRSFIAKTSQYNDVHVGTSQHSTHAKAIDWNFYFQCVAGISLLAGGALLILGLVYAMPGLLLAAGVTILAGCSLFAVTASNCQETPTSNLVLTT